MTLPGFQQQLQRLDLSGTGVGNTVLPILKHLPQLQQLILSRTSINWGSKAGSDGVVAAAGAVAGMRPADVQHLNDRPQGFPQIPAVIAAASVGAISQMKDPRPPAVGWHKLQFLDVTNTELTDAGCIQLAAELAAAAAAPAGPKAAGSAGEGLRVLHVGSSVCKLGRKALAGLCQLTTLQQLKLQVSCNAP